MLQWFKEKNAKRLQRRRDRRRSKLNSKLFKVGEPLAFSLESGDRSHLCQLASTRMGRSLSRSVRVGAGVLIYYVDPDMVEIGAGTELRDYSILEIGGRLEIGADCVIGAFNWLQASGTITIGNGVIIGPHCSIISTSHEKPTKEFWVRSSPLKKGTVTIDDNSWIGAGVSILEGVHIGKNVTIGAGSVVTGNIPNNSIAFGSPCRVREVK